MIFLEPLGERRHEADPGRLILAQCSKPAGENCGRGVGRSSTASQSDGEVLSRSPSLEGLLPLRLGVWSASWGGPSFREFPQGHILPYPLVE